MKRLLTPALNPTGLIFAVNALYALTQALLTHYHVAWGLSPAQLATIDAGAVAWARTQVTPVADPRVPGKVVVDTLVPLLAPPPALADFVATVKPATPATAPAAEQKDTTP